MPQIADLHQLSDVGQVRLPSGGLIVQTVDVVLPLPIAPAEWGRAAALHCLSDVYASGATPLSAVGILEVRSSARSGGKSSLVEAYQSAVSTLNDEGVALVGGHSLMGEVDKIGFAITGTVLGDSIRSVANGRIGDLIYLTKPIGSGAIFASISAGKRPVTEWLTEAVASILESNRAASDAANEVGAVCSSDVSGYGLLGTCLQIADESQVSLQLAFAAVPQMDGASVGIRSGIVSNLAEAVWLENRDRVRSSVGAASMLLLADPQVSGGLVVLVSPSSRTAFEAACEGKGVDARQIGEVVARETEAVIVD